MDKFIFCKSVTYMDILYGTRVENDKMDFHGVKRYTVENKINLKA